jgi:two-component system heavy metal sensor histidine kinase CusS
LSHLSLTQRLTLMFVTAATGVLLLLGLVIATSVEQHFEDLDMEVLAGKMALIRQGLQGVHAADGMTPFTHQLARALVGHHGLEVMVMDASHEVIFATAHAAFNPQQVLTQATQTPDKPALWMLQGQTYRVVAATMPMHVTVAVATDIAHHQTYMQSFLQTLWFFVAGAALLTGVLAWVVVQRGLAPLHAMRAQAQGVTAQRLSLRLPTQHIPQELAELAQSLNDMLARLEDAFCRLSDFSSDIAHELRTPVSNLMTQTQVALSRARSAEDYRGILESNAEEFERMARMIADMLLLAKADNGLVIPHRETMDLTTEVKALFDYYEAVADDKGLRLVQQGQGLVSADKHMLRRALGNLLSNALRHATPNTPVQVTLVQNTQGVTIAVENTGDPIAPEFLERVFDRFFRVDASRQRSSEGTGLGLAITKSIIAAHGGTIKATSNDTGTTLTVTLPHAIPSS